MTTEAEAMCPFCGEQISIVVDCSEDDQVYIEDCFVCCRPIQFHIVCSEHGLVSITADR